MGFEAKIIAHSIGPDDQELITTQFKYPRFIHAEFMTHREFSRNASSSRAIPVKKMIEQVRNDPAMPIHWGSNQPGMQADNQLTPPQIALAKCGWLAAAKNAADEAESLAELGLHKQVANRILEPYQWMHVICTTAKTSNFMGLRRHKDAQPEIKHLADLWHEQLSNSKPNTLYMGDWHLPYITEADYKAASEYLRVSRLILFMPTDAEITNLLVCMSAARCARVSYLTHDGLVPSVQEDINLYKRLVGAQPLHASPTEHQATPDLHENGVWDYPNEHGNLPGWRQFRKMLPGEYIA